MRPTLIVLALSTVLAACGRAPEPTASTHSSPLVGQIDGTRPLVTVLTTLSGPQEADPSLQWKQNDFTVGKAIPDGSSAVSQDVVLTDISNGSCAALLGLTIQVDVTHPHPADLQASLAIVSRDGSTVITSKLVKSVHSGGNLDFTSLLPASDCARFRVSVYDRGRQHRHLRRLVAAPAHGGLSLAARPGVLPAAPLRGRQLD
jgi:hypothetical protein